MERRIEKLLFIPIILILGVLPLVVRMKVGVITGAAAGIFHKTEYVDFYAQYKGYFMLGIVLLIFVMMFFFYNKNYIKKDSAIILYIIGTALFLGFGVISTILSEFREIAVWGVYDRAEGIIALGCYIIIMFYALYAFNKEEDYKYIVGALSFVAIIMAALGITQYVGKDIMLTEIGKRMIIPNELAQLRDDLTAEFDGAMITGTLYNPNYVGSFCAMLIPIFGLWMLFNKNKKTRVFLGFTIMLTFFLLFGSGSSAGVLGTIVAIILSLIIFSKILWQVVKAKKNVVIAGLGVLAVLLGVSNQLWYEEVSSIVTQSIQILLPSDKDFDYKNYIPIRDIVTKDRKTTLTLQKDSITIAYQDNQFRFYDSSSANIDYKIENDLYVTNDPRFNDYSFKIFYAEGNDKLMAGLALLDNTRKDAEGKSNPLFLFKGTAQEGVYIMDPTTQERADIIYPETIGFKGKEKLGSGRGYIWSRTIPMLKHTIFTGYGPDTFALEFPQRDYLGKMYGLSHLQLIVDKPHNMYLQMGVNEGLIALLGFLILVVTYVINSLKLYSFKNYYQQLDIIGVSITLSITGYLVAGIFNDSAISVAPIFWALLGTGIAVNYLVTKNREEAKS